MKSIRSKIGNMFLVLVLIVVASCAYAIYYFWQLGQSVEEIFRENYQSILAAENMVKSVERQQNASLSLFVEHPDSAREQYFQFRNNFVTWYKAASDKKDLLPGEREILDSLVAAYRTYSLASDSLYEMYTASPNPRRLRRFLEIVIRPAVARLNDRCNELLEINQKAIRQVGDTARRKSLEGTAAVLFAMIMAAVLSAIAIASFSRMVVRPAERLTSTIQKITQGSWHQKIDINTDDEFGVLGREINKMTERLKTYEEMNIQQIVTEKKTTEAVVASIADPIIVADSRQRLLLLNNAALRLLHAETSDWLGRPIARVVRNEPLRNLLLDVGRTGSADAQREKLLAVQEESSAKYFQYSHVPITDERGRLVAMVTTLQDVTHFKNLDMMKSEFMAAVSHELRTPLTSIGLTIDILAQQIAGAVNEKQKDLLAASKSDYNRLNKLINEILRLSRLESGKYKVKEEEINFADIIEEAVKPLRLQFSEKGIGLFVSVSPDLPMTTGDREQMIWVVSNLVSNALRYTNTDGRVEIAAAVDGGEIRMTVSDTGRGIPAHALETIFDKFVQLKQADDNTPGSVGLGLAIAKQVIEAHGGRLWAESELGKGSVFTCALPLSRNPGHTRENEG